MRLRINLVPLGLGLVGWALAEYYCVCVPIHAWTCQLGIEYGHQVLSKYQRAKKAYMQDGGALTTQEAREIINEKGKGKRPAGDMTGGPEEAVRGGPTNRRCGNCGETGHNAQTCEKDVESSVDTAACEHTEEADTRVI